jgi:hypothetical protein
MKIFTSRNVLLTILACAVTIVAQTTPAAPDPPNPVLAFLGNEYVESGGKKMMRYYFDVHNKDEYPADMFAAAPTLPPCGTNTKASRTWVDIYDQNGKKLNSFCALGKPADLSRIWFALSADEVPPSWVYIEFNDRKTNKKYKSNLAETTL